MLYLLPPHRYIPPTEQYYKMWANLSKTCVTISQNKWEQMGTSSKLKSVGNNLIHLQGMGGRSLCKKNF